MVIGSNRGSRINYSDDAKKFFMFETNCTHAYVPNFMRTHPRVVGGLRLHMVLNVHMRT